MAATNTIPRIYVACLASYNQGILHGRWIDADEGVEHIEEQVALMLADSPEANAEEWAIHDHENLGDIGESESFDRVAEIGEAVSSSDDPAALLAWLDYHGGAADLADFENDYYGQFESEEHFAQEFYEDGFELGVLDSYIDWAAVGRDLCINDFHSIDVPGGVLIFRSN